MTTASSMCGLVAWPRRGFLRKDVATARRRRLAAEQLERRYALDGVPSATVRGPVDSENNIFTPLINEEVPFVVSFDNTAAAGAANVGYSPFVDIVMPKVGNAPLPPDNGIAFKPNSATYNGMALQTTVLEFDASGQATHPFAKDAAGNPLVIQGTPGDQLVVVQLPFGSYAPEQPEIEIDFTGIVSPNAQPDQSYAVTATGGFRYQLDAAGNPTVDEAIVGAPSTDPIEPKLFRITKTSNPPEHETATGPNFTHTYTVSMAVAPGQTVTDLLLEDTLPDEVQFVAVTNVSGNGSTSITPVDTPTATTPGGTLSRQFDQVVGTGSSTDVRMSFTYYVAQKDASSADSLAALQKQLENEIQAYYGAKHPETSRKIAFLQARLSRPEVYISSQEGLYKNALQESFRRLDYKERLAGLVSRTPTILDKYPLLKMYYYADLDRPSAFSSRSTY